MNWENLLDFTASDLDKLTPTELEAILFPYYKVTRPEQARQSASGTTRTPPIDLVAQQKFLKMRELGIEVDVKDLARRMNKKKI